MWNRPLGDVALGAPPVRRRRLTVTDTVEDTLGAELSELMEAEPLSQATTLGHDVVPFAESLVDLTAESLEAEPSSQAPTLGHDNDAIENSDDNDDNDDDNDIGDKNFEQAVVDMTTISENVENLKTMAHGWMLKLDNVLFMDALKADMEKFVIRCAEFVSGETTSLVNMESPEKTDYKEFVTQALKISDELADEFIKFRGIMDGFCEDP